MLFLVVSVISWLFTGSASLYARFGSDSWTAGRARWQNVRSFARRVAIASIVVYAVIVLSFSVRTTPTGHVAVLTLFGEVDLDAYHEEGIFLKNPLKVANYMSTQRREIRRTSTVSREASERAAFILSKDEVELEVDATLPYALNPRYAPHVFRHLGGDRVYEPTLIRSTSSSALRNGFASFNAEEAYVSNRAAVAVSVAREFKQAIMGQLHNFDSFADLSDEELATVFSVLPVQLERVQPAERVRIAMNEDKAAEIELGRQSTLTEIEKERALRRKEAGIGIKNFVENLPPSVSVDDAVKIQLAAADVMRAEAFTQAVQEGTVNTVYVAEAGTSVTVGQ